jgi:hypothetical protein
MLLQLIENAVAANQAAQVVMVGAGLDTLVEQTVQRISPSVNPEQPFGSHLPFLRLSSARYALGKSFPCTHWTTQQCFHTGPPPARLSQFLATLGD